MNYKVSDTSLASVANAIRTKTGSSSQLEFPTDFVSEIQSIPSGGTTLISKSITANGEYIASSDNADGYSSVNVAVQSRLVRGTFTGAVAEKGTAKDISLSYSGSGYPIACVIYPSVGAHKTGSSMEILAQQYAIVMFSLVKSDIESTPDFDDNVEKNQAVVSFICKNNNSDATKYTSSYSVTARTYNSSGAATPGANTVRFKSKTTLSVFIADASYGFKEGIEYAYEVIYSA